MPRFFVSGCLIICIGLHPFGIVAQRAGKAGADVWDQVQTEKRKAASAARTKTSAVTRWKAHIEHWGLDTSYRREVGLAGRLNSDGWSGGVLYGWRGKKPGTKSFAQLMFSEIKHEKEAKQKRENTSFPELGPATPFIYGKIANLYTLNVTVGREKVLLPGVLEGNVSVGFRWAGGFSLAMLKPYYLRLLYPNYSVTPANGAERTEQYAASNAEVFLNPARIIGAGTWSQGLDEMSHLPGATGEIAFVTESKRYNTLVKTVTLGVNGSIYSRELATLVDKSAKRWNIQLYAGLQLGKRW